MTPLRFLVLTICITANGCNNHHVSIELTPEGDEMHRVLMDSRILRESDREPLPPGRGDRIAHHYADGEITPGRAAATFKSEMPADVGGSGLYLSYPSEAGNAFLYMERFQGRNLSRPKPEMSAINDSIKRLEMDALRIVSPKCAEDVSKSGFSSSPSWREHIQRVLFLDESRAADGLEALNAAIEQARNESIRQGNYMYSPSMEPWSLEGRREDVLRELRALDSTLLFLGIDRKLLQEKAMPLADIRNSLLPVLARRAEALTKVGDQMDPWAAVEMVDEVSDRIVDDLIGWWGWELSDSPRWPQIEARLDQAVRRDLKNLSMILFFYPRKTTSLEANIMSTSAMALLFLQERGVNVRELLPLSVLAWGDDTWEGPANYLRETLESSLEVPLAFLALDRIEASYQLHVERQGNEPAFADLGDLLESCFDLAGESMPSFSFFGSSTSLLRVHLDLPREPLSTNGVYDSSQGTVRWPFEALHGNQTYPQVLFCHWVVPDEAWQAEHLGAPQALDGEGLVAYAFWRNSLPPDHAEVWSAFVAGLKPDESGVQSLRTFSFPGQDTSSQPYGVEMLLELLAEEEEY